MQRLIKILILSLSIHFGFQLSTFAIDIQEELVIENKIDSKIFQEKPKDKKKKTDSVESPIQIMFKDLLEYLYFPGVPEDQKEKNDSDKKNSSDKQKKKN